MGQVVECEAERQICILQFICGAMGIPKLSPSACLPVGMLPRIALTVVKLSRNRNGIARKLYHLLGVLVTDRPTVVQECLQYAKTSQGQVVLGQESV